MTSHFVYYWTVTTSRTSKDVSNTHLSDSAIVELGSWIEMIQKADFAATED